MRKKITFVIINIVIPLMLGGIFYYLFCKDVLFVQKIDEITGVGFHINIENKNMIFKVIRNNVLDGIWAYALMQMLFSILTPKKKLITVCVLIVSLTGIVLELFQLAGLISGVFDIWDIIAEVIGSLFAISVIKFGGKNK